MAQTFGCPPHVLATATAADGALNLMVFSVGMEIEGAIQRAQAAGGKAEMVLRDLERAVEAEIRLEERDSGR